MNIAVCIKQVPDSTELRIDPETNTLIREGVDAVLNPLDEFPLEAALRLREAVGGSVCAFTMGPPGAAAVLRTALAMGADCAVLLSDPAFAGGDTWSTSLTLARGIQSNGPFDVILCGKQATDGDTAQVGPGIAAHLDIPQATYVTELQPASAREVRVRRMLDAGTAELRVRLPAVLTVLKEANEPRLPTLSGRIRALHWTADVQGCERLDLAPSSVGLEGSPTRVEEIAVPEAARTHVRIEGTGSECARRLADILRTRDSGNG